MTATAGTWEQGDEEAYSLLFTYCFRRTADTADRIRAKTVLHQIMICPQNKGGAGFLLGLEKVCLCLEIGCYCVWKFANK